MIGDHGNNPTQIGTNNYQTDDNVNWVLGKHSLDISVELVRLQYNMFQTSAEHGSETYSTTYTNLAWTDLLFDAPYTGSHSYPAGTVGLRQSDLAFYVQDNFKVSHRLTLNLGLRYENFLGWPWTEVNHKEYNFVPFISTTSLIQVGTQGVPRSGAHGNNLNFAPRIGFAYRLANKRHLQQDHFGGICLYLSATETTGTAGGQSYLLIKRASCHQTKQWSAKIRRPWFCLRVTARLFCILFADCTSANNFAVIVPIRTTSPPPKIFFLRRCSF